MITEKETPLLLTPDDLLRGRTFWKMPNNQLLYQENGRLVITNVSANRNYSAQDYAQLPEGAPYQLINQKLTFMAFPTDFHQVIVGNIYFLFKLFLRQNPIGQVRIAPLDVYFDAENVYQPDVFFVTNDQKSILQEKHVKGVPNLTIEVLSSGTAHVDRHEKLENYSRFGVQEYWLIYPENQIVEVYNLQNSESKMKLVEKKNLGTIESEVMTGFSADLQEIFAQS